jgi:hypothetical protein
MEQHFSLSECLDAPALVVEGLNVRLDFSDTSQ